MGEGSEKQRKLETAAPQFTSFMFTLMGLIVIVLAFLLWSGNILLFHLNYKKGDEMDHIPPTRCLASVGIPLFFSVRGFRKKSVNRSGAILGLIIGFFLTLSSYCFLADLLAFFIISSKATKYKSNIKNKFEEDFKEGGQRNWIQVICNGGMAAFLSLLYILDYGCGESAVNFSSSYRASWLSLGVLGAFACSNGDTLASELGTVLGGEPFLITTFRKVPIGTNGGVSISGLIISFLGGIIIGISHYLAIIICVDSTLLMKSPPQWPLILIGGFAGFFGSMIDSVLGATLQFSGIEKSKGYITERSGHDVVRINGWQILDNNSINLLSSVLMGYLTPACAKLFLS